MLGKTDGNSKYRRPEVPTGLLTEESESESTYIKRFLCWWAGLVLGISALIAVVKGIALITTTFGNTAGAIATCIATCAIIAAILAGI